MQRRSRAARRPRSRASGAPRRGSARRAASAAGAAARRRTRAGSCRARPRPRPGRGSARSRSPREACSGSRGSGRPTGRDPSAGRGAGPRGACRGRRSWRSGRARSGAPRDPRTRRGSSRHGRACPARHPRHRTASRACGSSSRSAPTGAARAHRRRALQSSMLSPRSILVIPSGARTKPNAGTHRSSARAYEVRFRAITNLNIEFASRT